MPKPLIRFKLFDQSTTQEKFGYPIICTIFDNDKDIGLGCGCQVLSQPIVENVGDIANGNSRTGGVAVHV